MVKVCSYEGCASPGLMTGALSPITELAPLEREHQEDRPFWAECAHHCIPSPRTLPAHSRYPVDAL